MPKRSQVIGGRTLSRNLECRRKLRWRLLSTVAAVLAAMALLSHAAHAADTPDYYTGSTTGDLATGSNWSTGAVPTITNDVAFPVGAATGIRTLNSGSLTVGSLDVQAVTGTFSIRNESGVTNSTITLGGAGNLGNSVTIRQANDLIFVTGGATLNLYGTAPTFTGALMGITLGQANGFIDSDGATNIGAVISDGGNGYGFTKSGTGTLTLSGANTYTGATRIGRGTLGLNFADATFTTPAPTSNIISSSSRLVFDGESTLALTGKSAVQTSQTFNGTTLNGFGSVTLAAGANNAGSGVALNLGAITRNAGGGINITQPTVFTTISATNGVTTTTANDVNSGILGGWAIVGNADWATNNGTNIVALAVGSYTVLTTAGGTQNATNFRNDTGNVTLTGAVTANSLKLSTAGTITMGANNITLNGTKGGILTTAATTINTSGGGVLSAGSGNELILSGNNTLTITGNNLIGNNAGSLTINGGAIISGANSYTGGTTLNSGTVQVQNNSALGSGAITFRGGVITSSARRQHHAHEQCDYGAEHDWIPESGHQGSGSLRCGDRGRQYVDVRQRGSQPNPERRSESVHGHAYGHYRGNHLANLNQFKYRRRHFRLPEQHGPSHASDVGNLPAVSPHARLGRSHAGGRVAVRCGSRSVLKLESNHASGCLEHEHLLRRRHSRERHKLD